MTQQTLREKTYDLVTDVIDRIACDEKFREALKIDPAAAMGSSGYAQRVDQLIKEVEGESKASGFASITPRLGGISRIALRNTTILASSPPSTAPTCGCPDDEVRVAPR